MIHKEALGSVIGALLIFIFAIYSLVYIREFHSPSMFLDFVLIQLSLFLFLIGFSLYASLLKPSSVLFWTRVCYAGAALALGSSYRFYESLKEETHGLQSRIFEGISLLLIFSIFFSGDLIFTGDLNPEKTHSSVIKGELFPPFIIIILATLSCIVIRTVAYVLPHRREKVSLRPIVYGLIVFFLAAFFDGIFAALLSLPRPQLWIGPTSLALSLAVYAAGIAREHQEEMERIRLEKEIIYHNLIHDKITGLFTRDFLMESLNQASCRKKRSDRKCCLLYLDVDNFKLLNDSLGHRAGDRLLREFGRILREKLRNYDVPARIGGDEFAILLPDSSGEGALKVSRSVQNYFLKIVYETFPDWKYRDKLTLSIGILTGENWGSDPEFILKRADRAMYTSKKSGKNRITDYGDIKS